jgi:hypothetical protein
LNEKLRDLSRSNKYCHNVGFFSASRELIIQAASFVWRAIKTGESIRDFPLVNQQASFGVVKDLK